MSEQTLERRCDTCEHWFQLVDDDDGHRLWRGQCRRHPPVPREEKHGLGRWPVTLPDAHCGEWTAHTAPTARGYESSDDDDGEHSEGQDDG